MDRKRKSCISLNVPSPSQNSVLREEQIVCKYRFEHQENVKYVVYGVQLFYGSGT